MPAILGPNKSITYKLCSIIAGMARSYNAGIAPPNFLTFVDRTFPLGLRNIDFDNNVRAKECA